MMNGYKCESGGASDRSRSERGFSSSIRLIFNRRKNLTSMHAFPPPRADSVGSQGDRAIARECSGGCLGSRSPRERVKFRPQTRKKFSKIENFSSHSNLFIALSCLAADVRTECLDITSCAVHAQAKPQGQRSNPET